MVSLRSAGSEQPEKKSPDTKIWSHKESDLLSEINLLRSDKCDLELELQEVRDELEYWRPDKYLDPAVRWTELDYMAVKHDHYDELKQSQHVVGRVSGLWKMTLTAALMSLGLLFIALPAAYGAAIAMLFMMTLLLWRVEKLHR